LYKTSIASAAGSVTTRTVSGNRRRSAIGSVARSVKATGQNGNESESGADCSVATAGRGSLGSPIFTFSWKGPYSTV
jgi:hypothetical protein